MEIGMVWSSGNGTGNDLEWQEWNWEWFGVLGMDLGMVWGTGNGIGNGLEYQEWSWEWAGAQEWSWEWFGAPGAAEGVGNVDPGEKGDQEGPSAPHNSLPGGDSRGVRLCSREQGQEEPQAGPGEAQEYQQEIPHGKVSPALEVLTHPEDMDWCCPPALL
ncbi:hypothetical protein HGM15179_014015 [Zosterops borbonicus]|uniref:Uncharacterized protein n=1 Tax=Zosterops borbonicus TaxID=364589 RepID=A0A8K1LGM3_9PASS|nr:hypothetical protein HGM15179_014015 [Zosterops borbonicus]